MRNIALIGFMVTGKSTIGKLLAQKTGYAYADSDDIIEERTGLSIPEIFQNHGEGFFRELEKQVLSELSDGGGRIISAGGGAVLDPGNIQALRRSSTIVCLKASPGDIWNRTKHCGSRPLIDQDNAYRSIVERLEQRKKLYSGDLVLDTSSMTPEEAVERILAFMAPCAGSRRVTVGLGDRSYEIRIGSGVLKELGSYLKSTFSGGKVMIVSSPAIQELWGKVLAQSLGDCGLEFLWALVPDGEENKSFEQLTALYDCAVNAAVDRNTPILALGGGVIGDIAGFAASTYMRGVPYIQLPTTLLSQVDSSVGGKTAVNHRQGKNLIGSFYQPRLVLSDISTLTSLPSREIRNGLAEVIKYGVIWDEKLFGYLEERIAAAVSLDNEVLSEIVEASCRIKAAIVEKDEKEAGIRAILNYGHTIGHAVETAAGYGQLRHGEAVSIGMEGAAFLAEKMGYMTAEDRQRQRRLLLKTGLPVALAPAGIDGLLDIMRHDKKVRNGKLRFVLPRGIGSWALCDDISYEDVRQALEYLMNHYSE